MQVEHLLRQLALEQPNLDIEKFRSNHLRFSTIDALNALGPDNIVLGSFSDSGPQLPVTQKSNQFSDLDQVTCQKCSPPPMQSYLPNSRSYMLSSTFLPENTQQTSGHSYFGQLGKAHLDDSSPFLRASPGGIGQCKSISMNELRHRILQREVNVISRVPKPIDWMDTSRGFMPYPREGPYTSAYGSPTPQASQVQPLSVSDRLPPQYAGNYHKQAYLNNRIRSPNTNRINDRAAETEEEIPIQYHQLPATMSVSMESGTQAIGDRVSPRTKRTNIPPTVPGDLTNLPTPPLGRRVLPPSPNRSYGSETVPIIQGASVGDCNASVTTSRFRRLLAVNPNYACRQSPSLESHQPNEDGPPSLHQKSSSMRKLVTEQKEANELYSSVDFQNEALSTQTNEREYHTISYISIPQEHLLTNGTPRDSGVKQRQGSSLKQSKTSPASTHKSAQSISHQINKSRLTLQSVSGFNTPHFSLSNKPENGNETRSDNDIGSQLPFRFLYPTRDFVQWDRDMVSAWLYELGLGYSVHNVRRWLQNGSDLVRASRKEIEQEMGIRNPMHLKKLYLHLQLRTTEPVPMRPSLPLLRIKYPLDFSISAWLDDLGLSSYSAAFEAASADLLVLDHLTTDDLVTIKMSSELHFLSLRRGLQMLRRMNYDASQICRWSGDSQNAVLQPSRNRNKNGGVSQGPNTRGDTSNERESKEIKPVDSLVVESSGDTSSSLPRNGSRSTLCCVKHSPLRVCYWSQYRVMAWLHQIELPEYASELSGSGVHGALLVLEDRFTAELLASILHIPPSKTLVRRHLANKFAELVGEYMSERKREVRDAPDISPLTVHSKTKISRKRGFFATHRKRKSSLIEEELVCPMDIDAEHAGFFEENNTITDRTPSTSTDSTSIQLDPHDWEWTPSSSLSTDTG